MYNKKDIDDIALSSPGPQQPSPVIRKCVNKINMNLAGSVRINKCGLLCLTCLSLLFFYYILFRSSHSFPGRSYVHMNVDGINMRKLLIGAIQVAQLGGLEVVEISKHPDFSVHSKGKTKEGANDPVTEADFRSHCVMRLGLKRFFPKLRIFSEEDGGDHKCPEHKLFDLDPTVLHESADRHLPDDELIDAEDVTVWIDPLDATQEYTEKLFDYVTTMVCVAVKGRPVIGVIHSPFSKVTTWSWLDRATSEDLHNLPGRKANQGLALIVSRSHAGDVKEFARATFGEETTVIPAAGAGYKVLQVLHGNATAYVHTTAIKKWDICAGNAILDNLKGKMTDLDDSDLEYGPMAKVLNGRGVLASYQDQHDTLIDKIRESKGLLKHLQKN